MAKGTIGVFDSGLGGLLMLRSLIKKLPRYDYVYLGDTKRLPYGGRSQRTLYQFLEEAVDFLFKGGCELIIVACNTASASALRKIQQEYLPRRYPDRKVLGVIIPTAEIARDAKRIGILATEATVESGTFVRELKKLNPSVQVFQQTAPLLVPLIENNALAETEPFLKEYLRPLTKQKIDTLILGCTHYALIKNRVKKVVGKSVRVLSQKNIIPKKLALYIDRHPEIAKKLTNHGTCTLFVTDVNDHYKMTARKWFGREKQLKIVDIARE